MICPICRQAEPQAGNTTVTLERNGVTVVTRHVPALVCPNCGEAYVDEDASRRLLESAAQAATTGSELELRDFAGPRAS